MTNSVLYNNLMRRSCIKRILPTTYIDCFTQFDRGVWRRREDLQGQKLICSTTVIQNNQ